MFSFQLQPEQLLLKALNKRAILENSQREMFPENCLPKTSRYTNKNKNDATN